MKTQRALAVLLVGLEAALLSYVSGSVVFPAAAALAALIGYSGKPRLSLNRDRRVILALLLALPFVMRWKFLPFVRFDVQGLFPFSLSYVFCQYFIALQALMLFMHEALLPPIFILHGVLAFVFAGNFFTVYDQDRTYQLCALFFLGLSALFLTGFRRNAARNICLAAALGTMLCLTGFTGSIVRKNQRKLDRIFETLSARMAGRFYGGGFSSTSRLGSVIGIRSDRELAVALRVFSPSEPGYLRGRAFEKFSAPTWNTLGGREKIFAASLIPPGIPPPSVKRNIFLLMDHTVLNGYLSINVWPDPHIEEGMFLPLHTAALDAPVTELDVDGNRITDSGELVGGLNYIAYVPVSPPADVLPENMRGRYLTLPADLDPRIPALAARIAGNAPSPAQKIAAVESYLLNNYSYGLDISVPSGQDPLAYFLLEKPAAHCEYFATAAAILLRCAGVPSRYVTGFIAAEYNPSGRYWIARYKDAHAWVEAYDDQRGGWATVEATPPDGIPRASITGVLRYRWDSLRFSLLTLQANLHLKGLYAVVDWGAPKLRSLILIAGDISPQAMVVKMLLLAALAAFLLRRRTRMPVTPEQRRLTELRGLLKKMDRYCARRGFVREDSRTLHEFAEQITTAIGHQQSAVGLAREWYLAYAAARYRPDISPAEVARLEEKLRGIMRGKKS